MTRCLVCDRPFYAEQQGSTEGGWMKDDLCYSTDRVKWWEHLPVFDFSPKAGIGPEESDRQFRLRQQCIEYSRLARAHCEKNAVDWRTRSQEERALRLAAEAERDSAIAERDELKQVVRDHAATWAADNMRELADLRTRLNAAVAECERLESTPFMRDGDVSVLATEARRRTAQAVLAALKGE